MSVTLDRLTPVQPKAKEHSPTSIYQLEVTSFIMKFLAILFKSLKKDNLIKIGNQLCPTLRYKEQCTINFK
jgi:hypothetical protein